MSTLSLPEKRVARIIQGDVRRGADAPDHQIDLVYDGPHRYAPGVGVKGTRRWPAGEHAASRPMHGS
jgi:hypothetical protein